jgi:hypothetical protein
MSKNNPSPKEISAPLPHGKKSRGIWIWILLLILVLALYFSTKISMNCTKDKTSTEIANKIACLEQDIARLNEQTKTLSVFESENMKKHAHDSGKRKEKWRVWTELCAKIESDGSFEEELNKFRELFAHDKELLGLVEDFIGKAASVAVKNGNKFIEIIGNMLKKIIRFHRIDQKKLAEISGYVLLSCDDFGEE